MLDVVPTPVCLSAHPFISSYRQTRTSSCPSIRHRAKGFAIKRCDGGVRGLKKNGDIENNQMHKVKPEHMVNMCIVEGISGVGSVCVLERLSPKE